MSGSICQSKREQRWQTKEAITVVTLAMKLCWLLHIINSPKIYCTCVNTSVTESQMIFSLKLSMIHNHLLVFLFWFRRNKGWHLFQYYTSRCARGLGVCGELFCFYILYWIVFLFSNVYMHMYFCVSLYVERERERERIYVYIKLSKSHKNKQER